MLNETSYYDPEVFASELRDVFASSWQLFGDVSSVEEPGSYAADTLITEPLLVVRGEDRRLRALSNVCRHRGAPVAAGRGSCDRFTCPYHGLAYDLEGHGLAGHGDLPRLAHEQIGPVLFVRPDGHDGERPFGGLGRLAEAHAGLPLVRTLRWNVDANWKLVVENFSECLHCRHVHPETLAARVDLDAYRVVPDGLQAVHHIRSAPSEQLAGDPRASSGPGDDVVERFTYWLWPNSAISLLPEHLVTFRVLPVEAGASIVDRSVFGPPGDAADAICAYLEAVTREDIGIVESVQRAARSAHFHDGALDPDRERGVAHFRELLRRATAGATGGGRAR